MDTVSQEVANSHSARLDQVVNINLNSACTFGCKESAKSTQTSKVICALYLDIDPAREWLTASVSTVGPKSRKVTSRASRECQIASMDPVLSRPILRMKKWDQLVQISSFIRGSKYSKNYTKKGTMRIIRNRIKLAVPDRL
ncbi:predicted protein [Histoplasma capsulatum var. duboisii H88]|uniref:Predicted protein n=1 Tax=Ajellomyces capsulatus (strain H88) TaxID=544711 RepID=F0UDD6_AJEC8|nr:predicted protein [Histoplasma capsulatum var. duboisii H88]